MHIDDEIRKIQKNIEQSDDIFFIANQIKYLIHTKGWKNKDIAHLLSISRPYVSNYLRILRVPELVRDGYYGKIITASHVFVISRLKEESQMIQAYEEALKNELSSVDLEEYIRLITQGFEGDKEYLTPRQKYDIEKHIQASFYGAQAKISQSRIKSRIVIEFNGPTSRTTKQILKLKKRLETKV